MLTVLCIFFNMSILIWDVWFSEPRVHIKLEGLSWFPSLGLQIFARLRAYPLSLGHQLNVLPGCLIGVDLAPYRLMACLGCGLKYGCVQNIRFLTRYSYIFIKIPVPFIVVLVLHKHFPSFSAQSHCLIKLDIFVSVSLNWKHFLRLVTKVYVMLYS